MCDGRIAFTGGLNIADEWVAPDDGGGDWHDAVVQVEGPAVATHRGDLPAHLEPPRQASGRASTRRGWRRRPPAGDTRAGGDLEQRAARPLRHPARGAARDPREPRAASTSPTPTSSPIAASCARCSRRRARGVDVRLLLPLDSDSRILDLAARAVFGPLLAAGVRIWRSRAVVHTKVLAVDDDFVSIGSYNFDHRSLAYNLEMVVNVLDDALRRPTSSRCWRRTWRPARS